MTTLKAVFAFKFNFSGLYFYLTVTSLVMRGNSESASKIKDQRYVETYLQLSKMLEHKDF